MGYMCSCTYGKLDKVTAMRFSWAVMGSCANSSGVRYPGLGLLNQPQFTVSPSCPAALTSPRDNQTKHLQAGMGSGCGWGFAQRLKRARNMHVPRSWSWCHARDSLESPVIVVPLEDLWETCSQLLTFLIDSGITKNCWTPVSPLSFEFCVSSVQACPCSYFITVRPRDYIC